VNSMEDRDGVIWLDGALVPWRDARVHVLSYTFQHGAGFFEGVRAYNSALGPAVFRLREHTRRFFDSAKILGMTLPFSIGELEAAQVSVLRANGLTDGYIRPTGYYDGKVVGVSATGNDVHVAIAAWRWDDYLGKDAKSRGVRVKTSTYARHHVNSSMVKAKATGHYINSMLAVGEAKQQGFDDALMLDVHGYVAECSTSNLFMARRGRLSTPERTAVLEGITRDTMMILAAERGMLVEERRITRDELYCADEIFVTGTAAEVTPVVELDGRMIGEGQPGPITRALQGAFADVVTGRDATKHDWLTPVPR
jgi:branched-chain amino acid aminotransferase